MLLDLLVCLHLPVKVLHRISSRTPQVSIRRNHAPQQLLNLFAHLPAPNPLPLHSPRPVLLQILLRGELLTLGVLEWRATDKDLEERDSKGPYV